MVIASQLEGTIMQLAAVTNLQEVRRAGEALAAQTNGQMLAAAADGDGEACHLLGVAYSTVAGSARDMIEAHKWFNLGAMYGCEEAASCRADISSEMSRREIAEAQRRAREWLRAGERRAA